MSGLAIVGAFLAGLLVLVVAAALTLASLDAGLAAWGRIRMRRGMALAARGSPGRWAKAWAWLAKRTFRRKREATVLRERMDAYDEHLRGFQDAVGVLKLRVSALEKAATTCVNP